MENEATKRFLKITGNRDKSKVNCIPRPYLLNSQLQGNSVVLLARERKSDVDLCEL